MLKRQLPIAITFLIGLALIVAHFVRGPGAEKVGDVVQQWAIIVFAFAIILGALNLIVLNLEKIARLKKEWGYSVVLIVGFLLVAVVGSVWGLDDGTPYDYLFKNMLNPLESAMFALLAFFIASACFRAFRAKTVEAALLLGSAFVVMLARVPIGDALWKHIPFVSHWFLLSDVSDWLLAFPSTAAQRAIMIGAGLGAVAISLKILLGVERSYLGGEE